MARFTIYSPTGTALYTGTPSFTGQYMKPGLLEFREIGSPTLLNLQPGCYVDYTRTGFRYKIYTLPQVKKQARANSYGGAFLHQGVQLYDASKMLEYCPFRDLVAGDNRIHFSTQPSISTFEGCDGLARRFEACLEDQYGTGSWAVRIASRDENPDLYDLMNEPREFTVSGVNLLECLDKIYEIWPGVGWVYKVEEGVDTIVIGGGGINANEGTYAYGKGRGLTSLTRTVANADEMANRIYAYGSSRNMLPGWYNGQNIKDADSVDIQNLMIPVSSWGVTDSKPDAAKAYVENIASVARIGLRPATVYFDGNGEYPEIYPTIREKTIGDVRTALGSSSAPYYPSATVYTDPTARIDEILTAPSSFDSGLSGADGKSSVANESGVIASTASGLVPAGGDVSIPLHQGDIISTTAGRLDLKASVNLSGMVAASLSSVSVVVTILGYVESLPYEAKKKTIEFERIDADEWAARGGSDKLTILGVLVGERYTLKVDLVLANTSPNQVSYSVDLSGGASLEAALYREKMFTVSVRQVGFDIGAQSALGDGKTIAMRSGKCAGRSFAINSVQYDAVNDSWSLECWRSEDESLSQWFPNTDYPIEAGNEFVLLDIAMPDIYITMAEQRLLQEAQGLLADTAVERFQYAPEIDAIFMVENSRTIRAGEYMAILDIDAQDVVPGEATYFRTSGGDYFLTSAGEKILLSQSSGSVVTALVDTIVINEGEAAIPTYKVTLRDRKRKTWTESEGAPGSSSKPVGDIKDAGSQNIDLSGYVTTDAFTALSGRVAALENESFFELDNNGNVTLKSEYENLWVPGWMAAGGVGTPGGGGGVSYLRELSDVYHDDNGVLRANGDDAEPGDALVYNAVRGWVAGEVSGALSPASSSTLGGIKTGYAQAGKNYPVQLDSNNNAYVSVPWEGGGGGGGAGTVTSVGVTVPTGLSVSGSPVTTSGTIAIGLASGYGIPTTAKQANWDTAYGWGDHANAGYVTLSGAQTISGGKNFIGSIYSSIDGTDYWAIDNDGSAFFDNVNANFASFSDLYVDGVRIESFFEKVNIGTSASPVYAIRVKNGLPFYSESWVSGGGVGSAGSGGSSTLAGLSDVSISGASTGNVLTYSNGSWVNTAKTDFLSGYATRSWVNEQGFATAQSLTNYVNLTTAQTVGGAKTFTSAVTASGGIVTGGDIIPSTDVGVSLGYSNRRFSNGNIANVGTTNIYLKNSTGGNSGLLTANGGWLSIRAGSETTTSGSYKQLNFHQTYGFYPDEAGVNLGYNPASNRWANIYGVNGNLSGDLTMARTSAIAIGPVVISYNYTDKALHISGTDDGQTIGLYCDGWVASGGIQQTS